MDFSIGLAGLQAASRRLDAAAFDVARASTQRTGAPVAPRTDAADPAAGATSVPAAGAMAGGPPAAPATLAARPAGAPGASVVDAEPDLPAAMVGVISASNAFLANLQTIRPTDEALGALLDDRPRRPAAG